MEYIVNTNEMRRAENVTMNEFHMPVLVLMEKAATCIASVIEERFSKDRTIGIVVGTGNNGGDAIAAGRILLLRGWDVSFHLVGSETKQSIGLKEQISIITSLGYSFKERFEKNQYDILIDGLLGIGASRILEGEFLEAVKFINEEDAFVLSVDIPSGLSADTGKYYGAVVKANLTVTFAYKKIGLLLNHGPCCTGEILVSDIGIPLQSFKKEIPTCFSYTKKDICRLPLRDKQGHKGTFGKVLLFAGSKNMSGAGLLAALATYRIGAGMVRIVTSEYNRVIFQNELPEALLTTLEDENIVVPELQALLDWADVVTVGPGMGTGATITYVFEQVLTYLSVHKEIPFVIDADGLNILSRQPELLELIRNRKNTILTPHPMEFARISKYPIMKIKEELFELGESFSEYLGVILLSKDAQTCVSEGKNNRSYINQSGNNGMATAGSGDVLAGILSGLLAQKMEPFEAACLAVYIHGLAGDYASMETNQYYVMAKDIIEALKRVL